MEKNDILNSDWAVRRSVAGNPNTPVGTLVELAKDSYFAVRSSAAGNPNTPVGTLVELAKDSDWAVRSSAAGNPNTPVGTLVELAKDSYFAVRRSVAGNPNTPGYKPIEDEFIVSETYVAIKGTNHIWYKHNYPNVDPFYTCGCFCGSRKMLLSRIYSIDQSEDPAIRMRILMALDKKFKEVFGR
ncbi:HEAT repeat domain-containing protein [Paraprevotella clara]|uniref:HEAT repeat domain-containing protein n=1 Tax=Paraprevotella clara TaxID=454154 RepID=UPI00266B72C1|nr:hypothetical protein [Paraprevotella clara]